MNYIPSSKRSLNSDPFYFGVFANLARHNAYKIISDISNRTNIASPATEENFEAAELFKLLKPTSGIHDVVKINKAVDLLLKNFRFLAPLNITLKADEPDSKEYHSVLTAILNQLENVRNAYSHFFHSPLVFDRKIIKWMEYIFDAALQKVRKDFNIKGDENLNHLIRSKGKGKKNNNFKYSFFSDINNAITEKGLAFFICLFLEKEYATLFLKKLEGFKKGDSIGDRATLEVYSACACRLAVPKLSGEEYNATYLFLDILNELQRCPNELYETFGEIDKLHFKTSIPTAFEDESEQGNENSAILVRKKNRFPYFALRYIDEKNLFKKLRFHVDLGNYHFKSYESKFDSINIIRRWDKKLLTYGRLHKYTEALLIEKWGDIIIDPAKINDKTPVPFLPKTTPHYHFIENNISLKITKGEDVLLPELKGEKPQSDKPDFTLATDELTGLLFYNLIAKKYIKPSAEDIIIEFGEKIKNFLHKFIQGEITPISDDKITKDPGSAKHAKLFAGKEFEEEVSTRKEALANKLVDEGLEPHQIPEKLARYLMAIEPVDIIARADKIAGILLDETNVLIKRAELIEEDKKKRVEKGKGKNEKKDRGTKKRERLMHTNAGENATFMAKDMLFMQVPVKDNAGNNIAGGKANPHEFRVLQSKLAYFGIHKQEMQKTFELCGLLHSENPHPFLHKIDIKKCNTNLQFYLKYLNERKAFLENRIKLKDYLAYHFLFKRQNDKNHDAVYFKDLATRIKKEPVNLPRGLFKDALNQILKCRKDEPLNKLYLNGTGEHSITYLLDEYYKQSDDSSQAFYKIHRNYRLVDEWYDNRPVNSTESIKKKI